MIKGDYILVVNVIRDRKIKIGKLGKIDFKRGFYLYVGSAQNGITQRIERHLKRKKKRFWHIDYLLSNSLAQVKEVRVREGKKRECELAQEFLRDENLKVIKGFGSSGCRCAGHLFYVRKNNSLIRVFRLENLKRMSNISP